MRTKAASSRRKPRASARRRAISRPRLETLQDLLTALKLREPQNAHLLRMFGATIAHISMHLGKPPDRIDIRRLLDITPALQVHLRKQGFLKNSARSYSNYVRMLVQRAKKLGWTECPPAIARAWETVRRAVEGVQGCSRIVRFAIHQGKTPAEFTEADL